MAAVAELFLPDFKDLGVKVNLFDQVIILVFFESVAQLNLQLCTKRCKGGTDANRVNRHMFLLKVKRPY